MDTFELQRPARPKIAIATTPMLKISVVTTSDTAVTRRAVKTVMANQKLIRQARLGGEGR
jgi:hypothetical protein